jgi:hypothetical protein
MAKGYRGCLVAHSSDHRLSRLDCGCAGAFRLRPRRAARAAARARGRAAADRAGHTAERPALAKRRRGGRRTEDRVRRAGQSRGDHRFKTAIHSRSAPAITVRRRSRDAARLRRDGGNAISTDRFARSLATAKAWSGKVETGFPKRSCLIKYLESHSIQI